MLPDPLHPAVVHLPLALAALLPLLALLARAAIPARFLPTRAWLAIPLLAALMAGGAWLALETGEHEEDRAERVVPEQTIENHGERAEVFTAVAAALAVISLTGLIPGPLGNLGRIATAAMSVVALGFGLSVGRLGGDLVYRHGAAQAYARDAAAGVARLDGNVEAPPAYGRGEEKEDDD